MSLRFGLVLLAAAALGAWLAWSNDDPAPGAEAPPEPPPRTLPKLREPAAWEDQFTIRDAIEEVGDSKLFSRPRHNANRETVTVSGEVVAFDHAGKRLAPVDGEISLGVLTAEQVASGEHFMSLEEADVVNGQFEVRLSRGAKIVVHAPKLDGLMTTLRKGQDRHDFADGEETELRLEVEMQRPVQLEVVDKTTGAHIKGVTVRGTYVSSALDSSAVVTAMDSPVTVPPKRPSSCFGEYRWVHAPGYTCERVTVNHLTGAPARVELHPAGSFEIRWEGRRGSSRYGFRYRAVRLDGKTRDFAHPARAAAAQSTDSLKTWRAKHLPAGRYHLELLADPPHGEDFLVVREEATIVAGETLTRRIRLPAPSGQPRTRLDGTLHYSEDWPTKGLRLTFTRIDQPLDLDNPPVSVAPRYSTRKKTWVWRAVNVRPGRYRVDLAPLGLQLELPVPTKGYADLALRMPDPATVDLVTTLERLAEDDAEDEDAVIVEIDLETGAETEIEVDDEDEEEEESEHLEIADVTWTLPKRLEQTFYGSSKRTLTAREGVFRFLAPEGFIRLQLDDDSCYATDVLEVMVEPGYNQLRAWVRSGHGLFVTLWPDAGTGFEEVFVPELHETRGYRATPLTGHGQLLEQRRQPFFQTILLFSAPGKYRLHFPEYEDRPSIPPRTVEVKRHKVASLVIQQPDRKRAK